MPTLLIRNGQLFDGTDTPSKIAHLLIQDGMVQQISTTEIPAPADATIIDAKGKWVMPGFIDNHTHYDGEVLVAPSLSESVRHGVTTVMLGGCSLSFIYADVEDCCDMFTRVEAFPREVQAAETHSCRGTDGHLPCRGHGGRLPGRVENHQPHVVDAPSS